MIFHAPPHDELIDHDTDVLGLKATCECPVIVIFRGAGFSFDDVVVLDEKLTQPLLSSPQHRQVTYDVDSPAPLAITRIIVNITLRSQFSGITSTNIKSIPVLGAIQSPPLAFSDKIIGTTQE